MRCTFTRKTPDQPIEFACDIEGEILKDFLLSEISDDLEHIAYIYQHIEPAPKTPWEHTGNAYCLTVQNQKFTLKNLYEDAFELSGNRTALLEILENWDRLIRN
jgi:uncharacterized protein YacL (UPF0231 family)